MTILLIIGTFVCAAAAVSLLFLNIVNTVKLSRMRGDERPVEEIVAEEAGESTILVNDFWNTAFSEISDDYSDFYRNRFAKLMKVHSSNEISVRYIIGSNQTNYDKLLRSYSLKSNSFFLMDSVADSYLHFLRNERLPRPSQTIKRLSEIRVMMNTKKEDIEAIEQLILKRKLTSEST